MVRVTESFRDEGISFSKVMAFIATYTTHKELRRQMSRSLRSTHAVAPTPSWEGFRRLVRERPVTIAAVDLSSLSRRRPAQEALQEIRRQFPGLGLILLAHRHRDPVALFRLGRAGIQNLVLVAVDEVEGGVGRAVARAGTRSATSLVTRVLSPYLPRRELWAVRIAMDGIHNCWSAEEYAEEVGLSRPFLSECFKELGLPSAGHLLLWTRLLHAGFWLTDPGRTAESVSRQLEYSSGAAFRRALKHYTGATPTEVKEGGGFVFVLNHFLRSCGFLPVGLETVPRTWVA